MSIRVNDDKKRKLKAIASIQGKTMSSIIENLIDEYITEYYNSNEQNEELKSIMKVSEPSFNEWDNDEDDVYDNL
ncbi:MAG: hypothetical protein WD381_01290 [Balneolaceae bacterium]